MYTWVSDTGRVIEQVRVVPEDGAKRAHGRVVSATHSDHDAFTIEYEAEISAAYELRRVRLTTTTQEYERTIELICDADGSWKLEDPTDTRSHVGAVGVKDIDLTYSVYFASLIIRRLGLDTQQGSAEARVLSVDSITLEVSDDTVTMSSDDERIYGITATGSTTATVDADGVILEVHGLSRRI